MKNKDTLLNLNKDKVKDITLLDINYRTLVSFSLLGDEIPLLIKLENIKYTDTRTNLQLNGIITSDVSKNIEDESIKYLVDIFFDCIEWGSFDFEEEFEYYKEKKNNIIEKNTYELKNGVSILNQKQINKELNIIFDEIIYNLKYYIVGKVLVDLEVRDELFKVYKEIEKIQTKIINEFNEVVDKIMEYEDEKNYNFKDLFQVMLKSVISSNSVIFRENIGKAFVDFSYREIKLRLAYEIKETSLNNNKMVLSTKLRVPSMF